MHYLIDDEVTSVIIIIIKGDSDGYLLSLPVPDSSPLLALASRPPADRYLRLFCRTQRACHSKDGLCP